MRKKLDDQAQRGILVGYNKRLTANWRASRVHGPVTNRIYESVHVCDIR